MRRRRNRSTWFPTLGFSNEAPNQELTTVDVRQLSVDESGAPLVTFIPIIPDLDVPPDQLQVGGAGQVQTSLRDYVEGQSCIIERVVGNIQVMGPKVAGNPNTIAAYVVCAAIAVFPTDNDGNPALSVPELNPLASDNSAQPWYWRRVWALGGNEGSTNVGSGIAYPTNNIFGSVAEGTKVDTKGVKRAIRREERIFLVYATQALFPDDEAIGLLNLIHVTADLRVLGRMVKARNRSQFG